MKKLVTLAASVLLALSLISCGKKIDSSVWLSNFEDGKKAAQAENKKIFLFFSGDDFDEVSSGLKSAVFNTEDFLKTYTEKYVLVNIDFSNSRYEGEQESLITDMKLSEKYDVNSFPCAYLLSKEGYVISQLAFDKSADADTVRLTFSETDDDVAKFDELIEKTQKGSTEERLEAINQIFDNTKPNFIYLLSPLGKLYLSLDKNNKSGQCSKYLFTLAYSKGQDYFLDNQPEKASKEFETLAGNKLLADYEKQIAYYTAGFLMVQSQSTDYATIMDYFQKAYDASPDTEEAAQIKQDIQRVRMIMEGEGDELPPSGEEAETPAQN
ncbi:MAG: thioredoxin family protein [Treponema sp.]|uniref:thioredoxin family protein n=1 Tax=Treponema sp. TaxID=166 RepID=UPI0025E004EE|nr:hypothetical protein [Treponema sp.]MBQ9282865.1 thioredoxin family protein [Treponema sp.]